MTTIDDAIEREKVVAKYHRDKKNNILKTVESYDEHCRMAREHEQLASWLEELKELKEKATPKKCTDIQTPVVTWGICPTCNGEPFSLGKPQRIFQNQNYCHNCGQRIDWSEEIERLTKNLEQLEEKKTQ